jgi:hypothetical protein
VQRFIVSVFLLAFVSAGFTSASEVTSWLDPGDDHAGYEMHIPAKYGDAHDDEAAHHFCQHNLLGLAIILPMPEPPYLRAEPLLELPDLYRFDLLQRLLRPPRI